MEEMKKKRWPFSSVLVFSFLGLGFLFTFFRGPLSSVNSALLQLSGELSAQEIEEAERAAAPTPPGAATAKPAGKPATKPAAKPARDTRLDNPITNTFPKTETPKIYYFKAKPSMTQILRLPPFPELRDHSGEKWDKEKTELRVATDGANLYFHGIFHDRSPRDMVVDNAPQNSGGAWKDDSVEFFLMRDTKADVYCQYIASAAGIGHLFYLKPNKNIPNGNNQASPPDSFIQPLIESERNERGFVVYMEIDLGNIGVGGLKPGGKLLTQVVRNYRGQGFEKSETLHLFPSHVYADNRFSINNHDRRAFQPAEVVAAE